MAEQDLKLAHQSYVAWNRGDADWFHEHLTEDIEVHPLRNIEEFEDVYRGRESWMRFWEAWHEVWSGVTIKVHRLEDIGDHGVLALLSFDRDAGDPGEASVPISHWLSFRENKICSVIAMAPDTAERRRKARR